MNLSSPAQLLDPNAAKARFGSIFRNSNWTGVEKCTYNPQAGWGDATAALQGVIQAAIDLGVEYRVATVAKVMFDMHGACTGAETTNGELLTAVNTVLCAGAHIAKILADSAPDRPEMHVGKRLVAAAAAMGAFRVPEDEMGKFEDALVLVQPLGKYPGKCHMAL